MVPVFDPLIVPTREPVMVQVRLVREPVIVPPKVTAATDIMSIIEIRNCPEPLILFLLVTQAFAGDTAERVNCYFGTSFSIQQLVELRRSSFVQPLCQAP